MQNSEKDKNLSDHLKAHLSSPEMQPVNLRSEAVQDILGRPPRWMIRWGISVIFIVILGLFVGSYFFKYPDIVQAQVTVNSEHLPANIVSKISGRIDSLFVNEGQNVNVGDNLALLQTPTSFNDYNTLKFEWKTYEQTTNYQ
jgi:multidrug resistance efflux pump